MGRFDFRTRTGQISAIIQPPAPNDEDAEAFFGRVIAAGGSLTEQQKLAVNILTIKLKTNNIWTSLKAIYPMVGESAAACSQNLKSSSFTGTFSSGWAFTSTGVAANGMSTFFNTGFNTSTNLIKTSTHISVYVRNNSSAGSPYDFANASDVGMISNNTLLITRYGNNIAYFAFADSGTYSTSVSSTDSRGFFCGSRISNTQFLYKNGIQIATGAAGIGNLANNNIYLGAANANGSAAFFTDKQYAFATIGDELSSTQVSNFYTVVQEFQTSLNRQV
jgi:hypothetical protein